MLFCAVQAPVLQFSSDLRGALQHFCIFFVGPSPGIWEATVWDSLICEDSFPSSQVKGDPEGFEEERRVFYVAVTRTKDLLYLITPSVVKGFRGEQIVRISPFISELNPKVYKKSSMYIGSAKEKKGKVSNKHQKSLFQTADELMKKDKTKR